MSAQRLTEEQLVETVRLVREQGKEGAADALGIAMSTLRGRLREASRRNLDGSAMGGPLPDGYVLGKVTTHVGPDGVISEWQHKHPVAEALERQIQAMLDAMAESVTPIPLVPAPASVASGLMTVYMVADFHLGLYAWGKETGQPYDLKIAERDIKQALVRTMQNTPASETGMILNLGDFFHTDNDEAVSRKSGHHYDVDSRYDKVLHLGTEIMLWMIELALQKHQRVIVKNVPGNHDKEATRALTLALWVRYEDNPRVLVDRTPGDHFFHQFGKVMIYANHGDKVKAKDAPAVMAAYEPKMWGDTLYRYAYFGHVHHKSKGPVSDEHGGAVWEIFQALTARDSYNRSKGYGAGRSLTAITLHRDRGEQGRWTEPIAGVDR